MNTHIILLFRITIILSDFYSKNLSFSSKRNEKWHVLQSLKDDLKIELDSIDFWQKDLPQNFEELDLYGKTLKILSINTLREVYKKASEVSQDNPLGNKTKFGSLNKFDSSSQKEP